MLAFKVHKDKTPNVRFGTFWIPIVDWNSSQIHLRNWWKTMARSYPIRYLTLISIPKQHPVYFGSDWAARMGFWFEGLSIKELPFVPLVEIEQDILKVLKPLDKKLPNGRYDFVSVIIHDDSAVVGMPLATLPELVLGADLPRSHIKWTKDIRLLTRGDKRQNLRKKADMSDGD